MLEDTRITTVQLTKVDRLWQPRDATLLTTSFQETRSIHLRLETGNLVLFCQKRLSAKLLSYHTLSGLIHFSRFNIFIDLESTSILSCSHIARESAYQVR